MNLLHSNNTTQKVLFTPFGKQQIFYASVCSGKYDFTLFGGSIRGGKSMAVLSLFLILASKYPGSRYLVVRKSLQRIKDTVLPSFYGIRPESKTAQDPNQSNSWEWKHTNGSTIKFYAENIEKDPELKRFRGLEYDSVCFEEMDISEKTFFIGFERCGTWRMNERQASVDKGEPIPPQVVIGTSNPQGGWVKSLIYDPWVRGMLKPNWHYIPSKVYDNPYVPQEWIDRQRENLLPERFEMMVEGDWNINMNDKPFFNHFDEVKLVADGLEIDPRFPLTLGFDFNYDPCSVVIGQKKGGEGLTFLKAYQANGGTEALLHKHLEWVRDGIMRGDFQVEWTGDNNGSRKESSARGLTDFIIIENFLGVPASEVSFTANPMHTYSRVICNQVLLKCGCLFDREECSGLVADIKDTKTNERGGIDKSFDPHLADAWRYMIHLWFESEDEVIVFALNIAELKQLNIDLAKHKKKQAERIEKRREATQPFKIKKK